MSLSRASLLLAALALMPLSAGEAIAEETVITPVGGLMLHHDPARWTVTATGPGAYTIACPVRECEEAVVEVEIVPESERACSGAAVVAMSEAAEREVWRRTVEPHYAAGLDFRAVTVDIGCRNLAGSPVHACTSHAGRSYFFTAAGEHCRTPPGYENAVLRLLNSFWAPR